MVLCVLFGIVGAVPLGLGFLVRTAMVRAGAARETSAIIAGLLEVTARYDVVVQAWPVVVALENEVVDELVVHGSVAECRAHVRRYMDHGVTVPALAVVPLGIELDAAVAGLSPSAHAEADAGSPPSSAAI